MTCSEMNSQEKADHGAPEAGRVVASSWKTFTPSPGRPDDALESHRFHRAKRSTDRERSMRRKPMVRERSTLAHEVPEGTGRRRKST